MFIERAVTEITARELAEECRRQVRDARSRVQSPAFGDGTGSVFRAFTPAFGDLRSVSGGKKCIVPVLSNFIGSWCSVLFFSVFFHVPTFSTDT